MDLPEDVFAIVTKVAVDVVRNATRQILDGRSQKRQVIRICCIATRIPQQSLQKHA